MFMLSRMKVGLTPPIVYMSPAADETFAVGEALKLADIIIFMESGEIVQAVGSKVTLHTDGMQVTATTTGGVAEITSIEGQTVGDAVTVKF